MLIGYMRVSKADGTQALDLQRDALLAAGVDIVRLYEDPASGHIDDRPGLDACLKSLRAALCAAPDWPGLHPVRPGQLRQHPAETAQDRRAGKDQCAPDPCRHRLGLSLSARVCPG